MKHLKTCKCLLWTGLLLLAMTGLLASSTAMNKLHLEPSATSVTFELGTTFHNVHGTMQVLEGDLNFDPDTGAISGRVLVDATTASTDHKKRDLRMHQKVLESVKYPVIVLLPRSFTGELRSEGVSHIRISGTVEIHGAVHQVSIPAEVTISGTSITGSGQFLVPYVEWGMADPSILMFRVKKEVEIHLAFRGEVDGARVAWHSR